MNLSIAPNEAVTFKVRHQDEHLLVVDKPAGLVTQPGKGHEHDTLLNGLYAQWGSRLQNLGRNRDFGLLHRLDKPTSGLLIVGLSAAAYDAMREAFAARAIRKFYWAVTHRAPSKPAGVINRPIQEYEDRGEHDGQKLARVSSAGKPSITAYRTLAVGPIGDAALMECRPVTGRLHQVRVHLASIGCEILGDPVYAKSAIARAAPRVMLHSHRVVFEHPLTRERIDVRSPCPRDMGRVLEKFGLPKPTIDTPSGLAGDGAERDEHADDASA